MARKKRLIVPIFIPFAGCPHRCIYCNQKRITSQVGLPTIEDVESTVRLYLSTWRADGRKEIAFYGGTFTALPHDVQKTYLECARKFIEDGLVDSIRLSTRPDCVDRSIARFLRSYGVETVELGAQSMVDEVLKLSERGHRAEDTVRAAGVLKEAGISVGIQIMPGLPKDTVETILETARRVIALKPQMVRIYPALVIKETPLERLYEEGSYTPWGLERMLRICAHLYRLFTEENIRVIRMGLQPTEELKESLVAGPFHPAFGELVKKMATSEGSALSVPSVQQGQ